MFLFQISTMCLIIWLMLPFGLMANELSTDLSSAQTQKVSEIEETQEQSDVKLDLDKAETKDPQKLEIIKQIRRLNDDGSYTVGYEADDGTFKIESRDVLGNIKGTYGYIDVNGDVKRVSYTANNNSNGVRSTTETPSVEDVVHIPSRQNKTTGFIGLTTRRPQSLAFLTSTASSATRSPVIQSIPKRRIPLLPSSSERPTFHKYAAFNRQTEHTTTAAPRKGEPTTTVVYAQSVTSQKPHILIRPTPLPGARTEQIARPEKLEITDHVSKVQISSNRETSTSKPVVEDVDEPETERKQLRGNFLRRQLADDHDETVEAQQQVIYSQSAGDDSSHVYGSINGVSRPLFSTSAPRIPSLVLAAKSRAAQLQNALNGNGQTTSTTEKIYAKPPRRRPESSSNDINEQTTESTSENNYLTQGPITVQIPATRDIQQATEEDKRVYRRPASYPPPPPSYRNREFVRQAPPPPPGDIDQSGPRQVRIPLPQAYPPQQQFAQQQQFAPQQQFAQQQQYQPQAFNPAFGQPEPEQYLRETTSPKLGAAGAAPYPVGGPGADPNAAFYAGQRGQSRGYLPFSRASAAAESGYEQANSNPYASNPYSPYGRPPPPSQYYGNPDRPLTARDFERLLNLLIFRHGQTQRLGYGGYGGGPPISPFIGGGGPNGDPYGYASYQQQIPRPPPFDPRYGGYNRGGPQQPPPPYGQYSEAADQMYQGQQDQQIPYAGQRLVPRKKQYGPQYFGAQGDPYGAERPGAYSEASQPVAAQHQEYLPPNIREELLYRMLLLAMQPYDGSNGEQEAGSNPEYATAAGGETTTTTASSVAAKYRKPVRSVQILGEE